MANSLQASKRARQNRVRRERNVAKRSEMRTYQKRVVSAVAGAKLAEAEAAFKLFVAMIDRNVGKGLVHRNKAGRIKSRLNASIRSLKAAS